MKNKGVLLVVLVSWLAIALLTMGLIDSDVRRVELLNAMDACGCEVP